MTRRMKLVLVGFGFLGSNGALFPVLESNLKSLNSLGRLSWGGHLFSYRFKSGLDREGSKLQLDSNIRSDTLQISFSESNRVPAATKLDPKKLPDNSTLSEELTPKSGVVTSSIESVLSEMSKESELNEVQVSLSSAYEESTRKHFTDVQKEREKHLSNFQKVQSTVTNWEKSKRDGGDSTLAPTLSQAERTSLQKIYELHRDLSTKKDSLGTRLEAISRATGEGDPTNNQPETENSFKDIKDALRLIGWSQHKVRVQKTQSNTRFYRADDWGPWDKNPFRHFYDEESEFKSAISILNKNSSRLHSERQSIDRGRSLWGWGRATENFDRRTAEVQKLSASAQSHIEMKVASTLLKLMKTKS